LAIEATVALGLLCPLSNEFGAGQAQMAAQTSQKEAFMKSTMLSTIWTWFPIQERNRTGGGSSTGTGMAMSSSRFLHGKQGGRHAPTSTVRRDLTTFLSFALCLCVFVLSNAFVAQAIDDNENSKPTAWWIYTGQTVQDITNTINKLNARVIDIAVDSPSTSYFTVTYVKNTRKYAKQWWWYVGIDANALAGYLASNNARLISLKAYDTGGGNLRFAVAMISNTGADAKAWWYYYGAYAADIPNLTESHNARLTALQSYSYNGDTRYAMIMISNTGADAKSWWWWFNNSPQEISANLSMNNARLLDLTPADNGNFNAVMESCSTGCPAWWWWYGFDMSGVLSKAQDNGARVLTAYPYGNCGSGSCFATVMIGNTPPDIKACDSLGCISEAKLSANIENALAGKVVGYSVEVGEMRPVYGGQARTAASPPSLAMAPDLVTNIASVSKTMTAIAILQLLSKNGLTIDTKISPYLYSDWTKGSNIDQITFQDLLRHASGFSQKNKGACDDGNTYSDLKTLVSTGVDAGDIGNPQYGNCNFALLRELMPALQGQSLNNYPDGPQRAQKSSAMYINYVNAYVFQPVGLSTRQCQPPSGNNDILSYPFPAGSDTGTDWGAIWPPLTCGAAGWYLSANDIYNVISDLAHGNVLLTKAQKKEMFSNCLGWDCAVRHDCPDPYVCKNGGFQQNGDTLHTYAGILKCNVPVVAVVNSPLPAPYESNGDIIGLIQDAYNAASVSGTAKACP
jgi:hypothetical protein